MKGYYTTETSDLYWYCKPRGGKTYTITEFYKFGALKGQMVTYAPSRRRIPDERMSHWIEYKRNVLTKK